MKELTWQQVAALAVLVAGVVVILVSRRVEAAVVVAIVQGILPSILKLKKEN